MDFLSDTTFLLKVNQHKVRQNWAAISVLDFETQNLVARLEGKVVSGNMSITANSSTRRTGSLNVVFDTQTYSINQLNNLAIDKKIMISIGITNPFYNTVEYKQYGNILWFKQGTFIITQLSNAISSSSASITMNFIDKSGFLNGTCGGILPASTTFNEQSIIDPDGNETISYPLIYDIIKQSVNHFGNEAYSRIIVDDVNLVGRQIAVWQGLTPICFATDATGQRINNGSFIITGEDEPNYQDKYYKGEIVGYLETDLTYPGELIAGAGETVATVLDKIKNTLGNYEWFYDVEGNFHFQAIPNFLGTGKTPLNLTDEDDEMLSSLYAPVFSDISRINEFSDSSLIISANSNPNLSNIKNDFVYWGTKNEDSPVRYHLAIDERPERKNDSLCFENIWSIVSEETTEAGNHQLLRYAIYGFGVLNPGEDWGECVAPNLQNIFSITEHQFNWREELYRRALLAYGSSTRGSYYDEQLLAEWRNLYNPLSRTQYDPVNSFETLWNESIQTPWFGYTKDILKDPTKIRYWLDIIDNTELNKFSVNKIGRRSIVKQDNTVGLVYNNDVNDLIFIKNDYDHNDIISINLFNEKLKYYHSIGQTFALVKPDQWDSFGTTSNYSTCYELIRQALYNNLSYSSSISITCIPIFYLNVNQVVRINLPELNIVGNYVIQSISWSLGNTQSMSLNLSEALVLA